MTVTRRDFMKSLGISLASVIMARCTPQKDTLAWSVGSDPSSPVHPDDTPMAASTAFPTAEQKAVAGEAQTLEVPPEPTRDVQYEAIIDASLPAAKRLRQCWEKLPLIERYLYDPKWDAEDPRPSLIKCHLTALNELVAMGQMSRAAAQELQQAFIAAIQKVESESLPLVCYD